MSERQDTSEYLANHLEKEKSQEESFGLDRPIIDGPRSTYEIDGGEVKIADDQNILKFCYTRYPEQYCQDERQRILDVISIFPRREQKWATRKFAKELKFFSGNVYSLDKLELKNNSGALVDVKTFPGIHGVELTILFNPNEDMVNYVNYHNPRRDQVVVSGDVPDISFLLKLFHEIGHSQNNSSQSYELAVMGRWIDETEAAEILKNERDAWAFALQKLRPFIKREYFPQVVDFVHKYALSNQSEAVRFMLAPKWAVIMAELLGRFRKDKE